MSFILQEHDFKQTVFFWYTNRLVITKSVLEKENGGHIYGYGLLPAGNLWKETMGVNGLMMKKLNKS